MSESWSEHSLPRRNNQIYTLIAVCKQTKMNNPARIVTLMVETANTEGHRSLLCMHETIIGQRRRQKFEMLSKSRPSMPLAIYLSVIIESKSRLKILPRLGQTLRLMSMGDKSRKITYTGVSVYELGRV